MFELAFSWAFALLPLPFLIGYFCPRAPSQLSAALRLPFFNTLAPHLNEKIRLTGKPGSETIFFLIWVLLLTALAGPKWVGEPRPITREGRNIMLALDLSGSMELTDMRLHGRPASRLTVVKKAAMQFVTARKADKIGLILFGSQAYLQTPLTFDHHSVMMRIDDATVGLAGKTTSIGDALGLAVKRLQSVPSKGRIVILLTDGVNNSGVLEPLKAAELAASEGITVYTIGLGANHDPRFADNLFLSLNAAAELDEETLTKAAELTGGHYFRATDSDSLHAIYNTINRIETTVQETETIRPQHDYYAWPLGLAILLFFIGMNQQFGTWVRARPSQEEEHHGF